MSRFIGCTCFAAMLALVGCAPRETEMRTDAPLREELGSLEQAGPGMPVTVAVERENPEAPRRTLVKDYDKVELTQREREILGAEPNEPDDLLAFYEPPVGVDRGVDPSRPAVRFYPGGVRRPGGQVGFDGGPRASSYEVIEVFNAYDVPRVGAAASTFGADRRAVMGDSLGGAAVGARGAANRKAGANTLPER